MKMEGVMNREGKFKILGLILVFIGITSIWGNVVRPLFVSIFGWRIYDTVKVIVIAGIFITVGLKLLSGGSFKLSEFIEDVRFKVNERRYSREKGDLVNREDHNN